MDNNWIKREDREPQKASMKDFEIIAAWPNGEVHAGWRHEMLDTFTHWMPLPAPPPRMVTIEIREEDARAFSRITLSYRDDLTRLAEACAKALESKR